MHWVDSRQPPATNITFSASPLFTESRKRAIIVQIDSAQEYLKRIGFEVLQPIPPLQVNPNMPKTTAGKGTVGILGNPYTPYGDSIILSEDSVENTDQIRNTYFAWAFQRLLETGKYDMREHPNRIPSSVVFACYYSSSYSEKNLFTWDNWQNALWKMRSTFSPKFVDTLLFYAFKNFEQAWQKDEQKDFDIYFANRLHAALDVVD